MVITPDTPVADIATAFPATIRVFQQHAIDFCCGGKAPLATVCADRRIDTELLLQELLEAGIPNDAQPTWADATLASLIAHIQRRYHAHLRAELPRLDAMLAKVVDRHGDRLPDVLPPLLTTFRTLQAELLAHMRKEDLVLFPFIEALEHGRPSAGADAAAWIAGPVAAMEEEHAQAGDALATMRALTQGYAPPEWACPTFRGLYYGLAQLEADMHVHVHLENNILFPRAAELARRLDQAV